MKYKYRIMKDYKVLALDETGKASFGHLSKNFVLSGFILPEAFRQRLDKSIRKLKKKHFNDEEIVLHCRDRSAWNPEKRVRILVRHDIYFK
jgi:hypothetical protein